MLLFALQKGVSALQGALQGELSRCWGAARVVVALQKRCKGSFRAIGGRTRVVFALQGRVTLQGAL